MEGKKRTEIDWEKIPDEIEMPCWLIRELELVTGIPHECEGDDCCPSQA